jgi:Tol biopolymer transport system component/C-terminal processing protease CtpA/Prc
MSDTDNSARPYFRTPNISPDGARIAFVYAGDIWLVSAEGGDAERLTSHPSGHSAPRWSPDGQQIAFSSGRAGQLDVYVLPLGQASAADGEVRRVTFHEAGSVAEAWSADGAQIYFSSSRERQGAAIYRVAAMGGTPVAWIGQPYEQIGHLAISPDGQTLAFNVARDPWWRRGPNPYGGADLWIVGNAPDADDYRKISDYAGLNRWPMWSADGQGLYFVSDRDGVENIWFQPLEGGPARKLTSFGEGRLLWPAISRDGSTIVFERDFRIWRFDVRSSSAAPLDIRVRPDTKVAPPRVYTLRDGITELSLAPDGKKVAFVVRGEVFADFADKETDREQRQGPAFRVTNNSFRDGDAAWSPDSRKLVYISDRHGDPEVYRYDFVARAEARLTTSDPAASEPKRSPLYSPDGKWVAYACADSQIRLLDAETGEDRPFVRANFRYGAHFDWSPDSQWLVFAAQDERAFSNLYVQRIDEDAPRRITSLSNLSTYGPIWSPDGRFVVFSTEQYREEGQIARVDLRPPAPLFREAEFEKLFQPAPGARGQGAGARAQGPGARDQEREEPKKEVTEEQPAGAGESDMLSAKEGARSPTPEPRPPTVEIVFEGIERRLRFLTPTQMDAHAWCISPDSRDLIFSATVAGKTNLWTQPLDEPREDQPPRQLTSSPSYKAAAQFAPDGKSFFFLDGGQIASRKFPSGDQTQLGVFADVTVDFNQEKRQMFEECWRLLRDYFYDPTFRGLDWSMARAQFAPLVAGAQTAGDLHAILNLMVGELRASHLGVYPNGGAPQQHGHLGLLFDQAELAQSGRLRVAALVPDSPAALVAFGDGRGLQPGDELLAVNGTPVGPDTSLDALLQRTVGRRVLLRIASGGRQGSGDGDQGSGIRDHGPGQSSDALVTDPDPPTPEPREVAVRPIASERYATLRYRAWIYANESYVHRISGGRLGYVHIQQMSYEAYQQFLADLDSETHSKQGVVVDVRFNGGGHTATFILDVLARRSVLISAFRDRPPADAGHLAGNRVLNKPTVLVINERSYSNTEMFAEAYRRLGLGKVVGRPTGGQVIWTTPHRLLDGSTFRLPSIKVATPEGEDLEGTGRAVDVDVPLPMGEPARGVDRQLEAAVRVLLEQIDAAQAAGGVLGEGAALP